MEIRPDKYVGRRRRPWWRPATPPPPVVLLPAPTIAFTPIQVCSLHGLVRCPCPRSPR